jgi:hypothetical protein
MKKPILSLLLLLTAAAPILATDVEKRVRFDRGASGTVINGNLDFAKHKFRGEMRDRYILGAGKGQTLTVNAEASGPVRISVWHKDYNQGQLGSGEGTSVRQSIKLPANEDYFLDVELVGQKAANYKLTIEIR